MKRKRRNDNPAKRAWIRQQQCIGKRDPEHECVPSQLSHTGIECCHEKHNRNKDDNHCYPGCAQIHAEDHAGRSKLEKKLGLTIRELCETYDEMWRWEREPAA